MWFNNVLFYQYEFKETLDLTNFLAEEKLKSCPPHARSTIGFLPSVDDELVHSIAGCSLICLGKEERILPKAVISRMLNERIQTIEMQQNRTVKKAEKAQLAEDLEFELLPKSFCIQKRLFAFFDTVTNRLVINTASSTQASQLINLLRKSLPNIAITALTQTENLALRFSQWINDPTLLPHNFQLASDCLLFSLKDEKKSINCKGYELAAEEILTLLSQGLAAAEISLIWNERIQFTLNHDLTLKRLKSLDYLSDEFSSLSELEGKRAQLDASLILLSSELRALGNDLMAMLNTDSTIISKDESEKLPLASGFSLINGHGLESSCETMTEPLNTTLEQPKQTPTHEVEAI